MRRVILALICFFVFQNVFYGIIFTEEFDNDAYIHSRSMELENGNVTIGYPDVFGDRYWYSEWGNFCYYNGYFYLVWSDVRYDGRNQVFLTKLDTSGNVIFITNVEVSIVGANNSYYDFATRPTISVYDANNIYVTFFQFKNGKYYSYTTKWQDTGNSLELVWSKRVDNGFGDNISYTPIPLKFSSTVDSNGNLYLLQVWRRVGSGEQSYISKILPDGTQYWLISGLPGTQYLTTFNSGLFIIAGEVLYFDGYIYVSGQHWIWSPSRDFGVGVNKISTNDSYLSFWGNGTNITTDRGGIYNNTSGLAPKVSMVILNGYLYVAFSDQRNGDMDVFLSRISTNNGVRDWTKLISGGSLNQEYPSISYDSAGNIYVSYVDWASGIPMLKVSKVDKDTGNVLGTMTFESSLYSNTTGFYLPKFFIDSSGSIYIFFREDGGLGKIRVKVAKYDSFGGNLLWIKEFPEIQYKKYSHVFSRRILSDLVGTPVSVRLNSSFSGNPVFKVSPDGGLNYYNATTNEIVVFTNLGNDLRVRIEATGNGNELVVVSNYTVEVIDFYTGDLFSSTNPSFSSTVGSNFVSVYPSSQVITNNTFSDGISKSVFHVKLNNIGNTNGNFYLYLTPSGWNVSVFDWNGNNVTTSFTNGNYTISLPGNVSTNFRVEVSVPSSAYDGEYQDFVLYSSVTRGGLLHDALTLRVMSWKYLPDAFISNSYTVLGKNVWELSPSTQVFSNVVNSRFYGYESKITNYIVVTNSGILSDVLRITNLFSVSSGNISDWDISVYNESDSQDISSYPYYLPLNVGQSKVIRVIVSPKTNTPIGAYLNLNFYISSTNFSAFNDDLRKDSVKFVFENHKYQPDLVLSTNLYFIGSVGEGDYVSTNTSSTQSIMVRTVNESSVTYYFKLRNDGLESSTIFLRSLGITNSDWSEKYYHGLNEITTSLTNGTNITLNPGEEFVFRGSFTPGATVESGVEPWVKVFAYVTNFTNSYDIVYARPRNIKVRPDAIIGYDLASATNGNNVYNSTGSGQYIVNLLLKGGTEVATNIVIVQNDSTTDPDIVNIVGDSQTSGWFIKYLDINDNDITHSITNTTNLTLPLGSSITLKVVSYPLNSFPDDGWIGIKIKAYSSYVYSQEDVVVISNRAISVKPDIGVFSPFTGWVDVPSISSAYEEQGSLSNKIIAGRTNVVKVKLKNDTGSIQDYIFKVSVSNLGGSISNWSYTFKSVIGNTTNDVTIYVTNNGWTNTYTSNQQVEVLLYLSLTNDVEYNLGTTNGAVSNMIELKYDFVSVFRGSIVDKGMHSFTVVRGMPDAYHESAYRGLGIITNDFNFDNYVLYGITKNYPRNDIVLKFKNVGDSIDTFRIFVDISNGNQPNNHITNWIFKFFDESTNDITSYLTNTNSGWTNNISAGYEKIVRMEIVNSNGFVNDNVFFYFYFESITKEKRRDVLWFESIITPGLPDVAISNLITGTLKGTNQFAPDSYDYQKLETNEKGKFKIVMRNIAPIEGYPAFRLKATFYGDVSKFDVYHTNKLGDYVDNSVLTTLGYTNNLSNYNLANGWPEDYLTLYVVPRPGISPGDKIIIRYEFSLYDNPGVYDYIFVTNQFVSPRVVVMSLPSFSTNVDVYIGKYQSVFGNIIVSNGDVVWEQFTLKANQSNPSGWTIKFYTNSTDVSSSVFGSGFVTPPIDGNNIYLFTIKITNLSELVSGTTNILEIKGISKKNTNVTSTLRVNIIYVDAIADVFAKGDDIDNNEEVGKGVIGYALTNKIEIHETNIYKVYLSNSINAGSDVRFTVAVESNYSPEFVTRIFDQNNNDITSSVFNSNYIVSLPSGGSTFIKVYRILTNTNSTVSNGFYSYVRISMNTFDIQNNIYDYIVLRDVVVYPRVDVRSASGFDNIFVFSSYSDAGKNLKTFKNIPTSIYLGIMNLDTVKEKFYVKASSGNEVWSVKYYDLNNNDITENVVNGSYITPDVEGGSYYIIKSVIKPSIDVNPADVFEQIVEVKSHKNQSRRDYITNKVSIESMFIVGSVKDKKTKRGIPRPTIEVTDPYGVRVKVTGDDDGNYSAPVYPVIGGLYRMKVDAQGYVGTLTNIYFEIGTNVVNFELVGLNMSSDKVDVRIFPNPMESGKGGSFVYALNEPSKVSVSVYDLRGKLVKHLVKDEYKEKGVYYVLWDGSDENGSYLKQGVYIFVINNGKEVVVKKLFVK